MIKAEEKRIRNFIKNNKNAQTAFNKMWDYYQIVDNLFSTNHLLLINKIYREKPITTNTNSLSLLANLSEATCYRHRVQYVDCFYTCFNMVER